MFQSRKHIECIGSFLEQCRGSVYWKVPSFLRGWKSKFSTIVDARSRGRTHLHHTLNVIITWYGGVEVPKHREITSALHVLYKIFLSALILKLDRQNSNFESIVGFSKSLSYLRDCKIIKSVLKWGIWVHRQIDIRMRHTSKDRETHLANTFRLTWSKATAFYLPRIHSSW